MKHLILLLLTLAHGGHWIGGHAETITLAWPAQSGLPASTLNWECKLGSILLASGSVDMPDALHPVSVTILTPQVRVPVSLRFIYKLMLKERKLSSGETELRMYPAHSFGDLTTQYAGKHLTLLDQSKSLCELLKKTGAAVDSLPDVSHLAMNRPDVLIIGPNQWTPSPLGQPALEPLARGGTQVILFRQSQNDHLAGYRVSRHPPEPELMWRMNHSLLNELDEQTLTSWIDDAPAIAIQLPPNEPALAIGYWKPETANNLPASVDALLATKTVGLGRIVFCQLPVDDWKNDPRSQILLHNLLAYVMTRPEPTHQPCERAAAIRSRLPNEQTITISPGAQP